MKEQYKEAIELLRDALDSADEARLILKKIGCQGAADTSGYRKVTLIGLVSDLLSTVSNLQTAKCDDCGVYLSDHDEKACEAAIAKAREEAWV